MPSAMQPATTKSSTSSQTGGFGAAASDSNRSPIAAGNFFQTQDATPTTALISPVLPTTTVTVDLVVPMNAITVILCASTACNISELGDMSQYFTLPAGIPITLDVARLGHIYAKAPVGTPALSFAFKTL